VNRRTCFCLLVAVLILGACGPGHVPGASTPEPAYPGSGDFDADGVTDVRDHCPRDHGPPDHGGCPPADGNPDTK
jgi:hypothetical protein